MPSASASFAVLERRELCYRDTPQRLETPSQATPTKLGMTIHSAHRDLLGISNHLTNSSLFIDFLLPLDIHCREYKIFIAIRLSTSLHFIGVCVKVGFDAMPG
ncbi:hypothetical protein ABVK25_005323 [Lepraria finkii]|uniref:Uncharacterized protein n=1 Tax=Lepraria finkii TaxID=1340010 RepID=A0ABR4B9S2_9LECA